MTRKADTYALFSHLEVTVAQDMAEEEKIRLIPAHELPPQVRRDEAGRQASCAAVFPTEEILREFNDRVRRARMGDQFKRNCKEDGLQ